MILHWSGNWDENAFRVVVRFRHQYASPTDFREVCGLVLDEAWFFGTPGNMVDRRLKEAVVASVFKGSGGNMHQCRGGGEFTLVYNHRAPITAGTPPKPSLAGKYARYPYSHEIIIDKIIYDERGFLAVDCGEGRSLPLSEFREGTTWVQSVGGAR